MQESGGCSNPVEVSGLRLGRYPDSDSSSRYCLSLASLASLAVNVSLLKRSKPTKMSEGPKTKRPSHSQALNGRFAGHQNIEFPFNGALQKLFFAAFAQAPFLASIAQAMTLAGIAIGEYKDACRI